MLIYITLYSQTGDEEILPCGLKGLEIFFQEWILSRALNSPNNLTLTEITITTFGEH